MSTRKPYLTTRQQTTAVRRLCRLIRSATPEQRAAGLGWYEHALTVCQAIAAVSGPGIAAVPVETVVGVFASLSPRCQVSTNIAWCAAMVHAARTGASCPRVHTREMRRQAWAIAQGAHWSDVLGGPKVRAFAANLLGDENAVTVDVWAVRAALGPAAAPDGRVTPAQYRVVADLYRRAAARLGITPREAQATAWMVVRGVKPTDREFHAAAAA